MTKEPDWLSDAHLAAIEARAANATGGPWTSFIEGRDHQSGSDFIRTTAGDIELTGATGADQDFIAHARSDVPRLVAELRRLRAMVSERSGPAQR